jgi:hypothetical protein
LAVGGAGREGGREGERKNERGKGRNEAIIPPLFFLLFFLPSLLYCFRFMTGSGSTYIYGHVDEAFKENMTREECQAFVKKGKPCPPSLPPSLPPILRSPSVAKAHHSLPFAPSLPPSLPPSLQPSLTPWPVTVLRVVSFAW